MSSGNEKYLTKRLLMRKSAQAFKEAREEAMDTMGFVVIVQDGWVVKKYADGNVEQLKKVQEVNVKMNMNKFQFE